MVATISSATSIFLDLFQLSPTRPDLKLLGDVSLNFGRLPWENLTKLIKQHGTVDAERMEMLRLSREVLEDHAALGAGGTCFSLTNALWRIATDLGFRADPVMADMSHGPNVHCALLVVLDGRRWLLDPGYLVAEPVALERGRSCSVGHLGQRLEYRPVEASEDVEMYSTTERGEERLRYRLRPRPVSKDRFVGRWLESFDATGMNGLHLNRMTSEGRLSAHDLNLRIDTGRDKRNVKLRDAYGERISESFGVDRALAERAYDEWRIRRCRRA